MKGTSPSEMTTGQDIARAAWKLLNECVRDQGGQGGVLSNLGRAFTSISINHTLADMDPFPQDRHIR